MGFIKRALTPSRSEENWALFQANKAAAAANAKKAEEDAARQRALQEEIARKSAEEDAAKKRADEESNKKKSDQEAWDRQVAENDKKWKEQIAKEEAARTASQAAAPTDTGPSEQDLALQRWTSSTDRSKEAARRYAQDRIAAFGGDKWGLFDRYSKELEGREAGLEPGKSDYNTIVNPASVWDDVRSTALEKERGDLLRSYSQMFEPGYESKREFTDEADDPILESILGEQQKEAQAAVDRAKARGVIGEAGTSFANRQMGNAATRGRSALQGIGGGILNTYRSALTGITNPLRERVTNWNFGDNIDLGAEQAYVANKANQFRGQMEGDVRNAVGDTSYFDTNLLLGRAGASEGATNLPGSAILGAAFNADPKKKLQEGKLGTVGVI